jgi:hypothetical protein
LATAGLVSVRPRPLAPERLKFGTYRVQRLACSLALPMEAALDRSRARSEGTATIAPALV